jgi:hypothetical protein
MRSITVSILVVLISPTLGFSQTEEEKSLLRAVANQYETNRAGFDPVLIEFELQSGEAASVDAAFQGQIDRPLISKGLYAVRGHTERYDKIGDPAEELNRRVAQGGGVYSYSSESLRYLWDDTICIFERLTPSDEVGEWMRQPQVYTDPFRWLSHCRIPLRLGRVTDSRSLSSWIEKGLKGEDDLVVSEIADETVDGIKLLRVTLTSPRYREVFWIDLERGALPVKREEHMSAELGGRIWTTVLRDIRNTPKGWLPFATVWRCDDKRAVRFEVTRALYGDSVDRKVFSLEFPKMATMIDLERNRTFGKKKIWTLADVGGSGVSFPNVVREAPPAGPSMPVERTAFDWTLPAAALATVGFGLAAWYVRRSARRAG